MQKASSHPVHSDIFDLRLTIYEFSRNVSRQTGSENRKSKIVISEWTGLLHIVGIWLQVLFHSPNRGSFHLSLAVLVHYRLPRSI